METRRYAPLTIILAAALAVKLGYLLFAFPDPSSVWRLSIDELYHYRWASAIASGDVFTNAPYFRAPLYPFVLALLLALSGKSLVFVRLIQLLLGCITVIFSYRLAERFAGWKAAVLASALLILYPITTYFEGELLLDPLFTMFAVLTAWFATDTRRHGPAAVGVCFALAALTRPTFLIFLPVIVIYFLRHRQDAGRRKSAGRSIIIFLLTAAVLISPVTIINALHSGQFILISYQGGINFYIGNNPRADGVTSDLPPYGRDWSLEDAANQVYEETGRTDGFAAQSSFWYRKGLRFIADQPGAFVRLYIRKLTFLLSGNEISNNRPLDEAVFANGLLSRLPIRFSILATIAVLPLFLVNAGRRYMYGLYGLVLFYSAVISLFFVSSRFRLPIVPFVAILSGWGLSALWDTLRQKRIDYRLFFAVVSAGAVFVASTISFPARSSENPNQAIFLKGNQMLRRGDYAAAAQYLDSLIEKQPDFKNAHLNLGIAHLKMGRVERAAEAFRSETAYNPSAAAAWNNLGVTFLLKDQDDSARYYCRRALEIKPYYTEAAINFLRAAKSVTDSAIIDTIERFRNIIRPANDDKPAYLFEEALYFTSHGRLGEAVDNHIAIVAAPGDRPPSISFQATYSEDRPGDILTLALYQLGYLYGLSGRYEQSIDFSRRAIERNPDLKEAYINLISAYRSADRIREADSTAAAYRSRWPASTLP